MNESASWLADGVKEIERVVRSSMIVEPKIISIPQEKPGTYGVVTPGPSGSVQEIDTKVAGPLWHNERLENPFQLMRFIESMKDRGVKTEEGAVYINPGQITYVFSFEDRRHRASCPLTISSPWSWLEREQQPMDQRTIIRLLRIRFDGWLPGDSSLISVLRNVKWKQDGNVEANLQRGREALGRQILNEAAGISNFPEEFILTGSVYENYTCPVNVRVALELLPDVMKFEVIPFPNQVFNGQQATLLKLQEEIAETKVPTFIGAVSAGKQPE